MLLPAFLKFLCHWKASNGEIRQARCISWLVEIASFIHGVLGPGWAGKYKENGEAASCVLEKLEDDHRGVSHDAEGSTLRLAGEAGRPFS